METFKSNMLDQFIPTILGIFWFTSEDLGRELDGFDDINYLFDGLISQYIYGNENKSNTHAHIFFTENFSEKIFLTHLKTKGLNKSQISGDVDEYIALIGSNKTLMSSERKTILVLDKTDEKWISELKKRYPQFEFRELID